MNNIKCIVVDDEPLAIALLANYITQTKGLILLDAFSNPINALNSLQERKVDLVFLDIQMPELSGIQFIQIAEEKAQFILTTAYEQYALQGYDYNIVDYLLKPITFDRFSTAIEKAKQRLMAQTSAIISDNIEKRSYIFLKVEYKILRIDTNDILYLEGARDYVIVHTVKGKIMTLQSMRSLEELLPSDCFIRIHKSYIIAIDKIVYIERSKVFINNQYLSIGDTYKESFSKVVNEKHRK